MRLIDGRQARAARVILGMTVAEMATAAGIDRKSVLRVEHMKGIRINRMGSGGYGVDSLARAIEERGIICDVIDRQPIVRFSTTAPPPKYRRRKPVEMPD
ncbi:hypothetical protein ACP4J4_20325 (plasmid) [Aureimonas ureilytica]|uniref:hypothetical protein n=1 Tax=Aureimonas ureilytica TaxID=401562 RepID=UPI003CF2BE9D